MVAAAKKRAADEAKDEASRSVPAPAELKRRRLLKPAERARVDKIDAPWRGVAKAYLEHDWPLPFWFSAGALAQGNETLELIVEQYKIDTLDELGHWFGAMCSDAYFEANTGRFALTTTNRDYADLQRANLHNVQWKTVPRLAPRWSPTSSRNSKPRVRTEQSLGSTPSRPRPAATRSSRRSSTRIVAAKRSSSPRTSRKTRCSRSRLPPRRRGWTRSSPATGRWVKEFSASRSATSRPASWTGSSTSSPARDGETAPTRSSTARSRW